MPVFVMDNGAGSAKCGYASDSEARIIPNSVCKAKNIRTRIFVGDQIDDCKDMSGLFFLLPFQKGFLTNWEIELQVWNYVFGNDRYKVKFDETTLMVTEPCFDFLSIQEMFNEVTFEEFGFQALHRTNAPSLSAVNSHQQDGGKNLCSLIVDSGYSFTHIVPFYSSKQVRGAIRRINVGGKLLTNHLKEIISYRQLMVMDETHVMNQMKEDVCYIAEDFETDVKISKQRGPGNHVIRDYVLPDYTHIKRGFVRPKEQTSAKPKDNEQIIVMNNERFTVPEILFNPSDLGISEMGVAECLLESVNACPTEMRPHLLRNIVVTGGNALLPGFKERLYKDVRALAPDEYDVKVRLPDDPITYAWQGGCHLATQSKFKNMVVTRQQYQESGHNICLEAFDV